MSQPYPAPQDPTTPGGTPAEPAPTGSYPLPTAPQHAAPVQPYETQPYTQAYETPAYPAPGYPAPSAPVNPGYGYPAATETVYPTAGWPQPGLVTDRREQSSAVITIAWVCTVLTFGYMLPWAIAATRGRSNQATIGWLNLLLGWSLIGWVVTLVMACQAHTVYAAQPSVVVAQQFGTPYQQQAPAYPAPAPAGPAAGWYPASDGQGQQYWDGTAWTGHRAP